MQTNHLFEVLVAAGAGSGTGQGLVAAGTNFENLLDGTLKVGQLACIDLATNTTVVNLNSTTEYVLVVGVSTTGGAAGTNADHYRISAGQKIKKASASAKETPAAAGTNQVSLIKGITTECDKEYLLSVEFRSQEILQLQGYVPFTQVYSIHTDCCDTTPANAYEAIDKLVAAINADPRKLLVADIVGYATTGVTDAGIAGALNGYATGASAQNGVLVGSGAFVGVALRLTSVPTPERQYHGINVRYNSPRKVPFYVSLISGFDCGTVTLSEAVIKAVADQGDGYDIKQIEYQASGWNGEAGVYRTNAVTGLAKDDIRLLADQNTLYDIINVYYSLSHRSGFLTYDNDYTTMIAIPDGYSTTLNAIKTLLGI